MIDLDEEIDLCTFDIEQAAERHDSLLRAPWEWRVCDQGAWHRAQRALWQEIQVLRAIRRELLAEREDLQR